MFNVDPRARPQEIVFVLVPDFSMMAFTASIEPLRAANRLAAEGLFHWRVFSPDGEPISASNGVTVSPDAGLDDCPGAAAILVCAGVRAETYRNPNLDAWLRRMASRGVTVGGVCTGPLLLARAGLLDGHRCTIHWENVESFAEEFPELDITATLFEIDRRRCTCSGGTAPLDMMINLIAADYGRELAQTVAEQMLHTFVRHPYDAQRMSFQHRTGISDPKVLAAVATMEALLEHPVSIEDLADGVGVSARQLERLFRGKLGKSPARYYAELRLKRARQLLTQTPMPVVQVAVACGFTSASHFAKSYRKFYGRSPSDDRARLLADWPDPIEPPLAVHRAEAPYTH